MGLLTGFSILSGVEVVYFLLRFPWHILWILWESIIFLGSFCLLRNRQWQLCQLSKKKLKAELQKRTKNGEWPNVLWIVKHWINKCSVEVLCKQTIPSLPRPSKGIHQFQFNMRGNNWCTISNTCTVYSYDAKTLNYITCKWVKTIKSHIFFFWLLLELDLITKYHISSSNNDKELKQWYSANDRDI